MSIFNVIVALFCAVQNAEYRGQGRGSYTRVRPNHVPTLTLPVSTQVLGLGGILQHPQTGFFACGCALLVMVPLLTRTLTLTLAIL